MIHLPLAPDKPLDPEYLFHQEILLHLIQKIQQHLLSQMIHLIQKIHSPDTPL
jgi:hypothetical protein